MYVSLSRLALLQYKIALMRESQSKSAAASITTPHTINKIPVILVFFILKAT